MADRDKALVARIVPELRRIFAHPSAPPADPARAFSYGDNGWSLSLEESRDLDDVIRAVASAYPQVHQRTCAREVERFCCEHMQTPGFEQAVPQLLAHIANLGSLRHLVYIQVTGMRLEQAEFPLGPVRFISSTHPDVDDHRLRIKDITGSHPDPVPPNIVLARVELSGDHEFAKDIATQQVQLALDCLQMLSSHKNPATFDGDLGFSLLCCSPIQLVHARSWTYTHVDERWSSCDGCGPFIATADPKLNLPINTKVIKLLAAVGLADFSALLAESNPSSFDARVATAVQWNANAVRERDAARKYLSFYIALEALFVPDDLRSAEAPGYVSPTLPVDEGVAFLLGKTPDARVRISDRIRTLSGKRNMIVHRGFRLIERADLRELAYYAVNSCIQAAKMRSQFRDERSFARWLRRRKFGDFDRPE
ncbi:MAG: HEPN domain-containing protein [Kiritimatiellae bacterium]|nr:HEPN domain-containing protein [Kiritimatiellia bacterium]